MYHRRIILLFLVSFCAFGQQQLYIQNPAPHCFWIKSIWAIDSTTVLAVSEFNLVAKTTNAGLTWTLTRLGKGPAQIASAGNSRAWMPAGGDSAYYTADKGEHWAMREIWPGCLVSNICFTDENFGFALGTAHFGPGYPLRTMLCRTRNGGASWDTLVMDTAQTMRYSKIFFIDSLHGWAAGGDYLVGRTVDGGRHWVRGYVYDPNDINGLKDINDIRFFDAANGTAVTPNKVFVTVDGGNTWTMKYQSGGPDYMAAITYNSRDLIIVAGIASTIPSTSFAVVSATGGMSWTKVGFPDTGGDNGFYGAASANGVSWVAGGGGMIARTYNGIDYEPIRRGPAENLTGISFTDATHGWAVGDNGVIASTKNGHQWSQQNCGDSKDLYTVFFIDSLRGWVAGDWGHVHYTRDGGATWELQTFATNAGITDIFFADSLNGWALCDWQAVYGTKDGGTTWSVFGTPQNYLDLHKLFFVDRLTGWVAGDNASLFKTTDGGHTWVAQRGPDQTGTMPGFNDMYFIDANTGWAVTNDSVVLKTNDGGTTWANLKAPGGGYNGYTNVFFTSANHGYISGSNGIYSTVDGGNTWQKVLNPYGAFGFSCLSASGDSGLWVAGGSGLIMGTSKPDFLPVRQRPQTARFGDPAPHVTLVSLHRNSIVVHATIETSIQIELYAINGRRIYAGPNMRIGPGTHSIPGDFRLSAAGAYIALVKYNRGVSRSLTWVVH